MNPYFTSRRLRGLLFGSMSVWAAVAAAGLALAPVTAGAAAPDKKAEKLWKVKCASCHGPDGKAQTDQGKEMGMGDMSAADWQKAYTDDKVKAAINDGLKREKAGKQQEMKAFKDKLKPEEVDSLVSLIRFFGK